MSVFINRTNKDVGTVEFKCVEIMMYFNKIKIGYTLVHFRDRLTLEEPFPLFRWTFV